MVWSSVRVRSCRYPLMHGMRNWSRTETWFECLSPSHSQSMVTGRSLTFYLVEQARVQIHSGGLNVSRSGPSPWQRRCGSCRCWRCQEWFGNRHCTPHICMPETPSRANASSPGSCSLCKSSVWGDMGGKCWGSMRGMDYNSVWSCWFVTSVGAPSTCLWHLPLPSFPSMHTGTLHRMPGLWVTSTLSNIAWSPVPWASLNFQHRTAGSTIFVRLRIVPSVPRLARPGRCKHHKTEIRARREPTPT